MKAQDLKYLSLTLKLAKKAEGKTSPNPMVGAVIVKNGKTISTGFHQKCGRPHAEIVALKKAGKKAKNAVLYVNLEPCCHFGRTPPCTKAIINAGIKQVVIGMKDPNPLNKGKGVRELGRAGIKVELAKNQTRFKKLNDVFIKYITRKVPYVIVKVGQSLDGKIATRRGQSKWITGRNARDFAQGLRSKVDAIIVGINTILKDNPYLSSRFKGELKKDKPVKIIVDSKLKTPLAANIFGKLSPAPVIIATSKLATQARINLFRKKGVEILICPIKSQKRIDLKFLMRELARREISSILVEGGGELIGSFFDARIVDKAYFFIAPKIIGGKEAICSVEGKGIFSLQKASELVNMKITMLREDILIEGDVRYNS